MDGLMTVTGFAAGLAAGLFLALLVFGLRRYASRLGAGLLRGLSFPFRLLLRLVGLGRKASPNTASEMGPGAWAAAVSGHKTLLEGALGEDFDHEESFISRQGLIFKWMMVRVGFMRMPEEMTDALAKDYAELADRFLGAPVPIASDPRALFEDVEGAVIAQQFADSEHGLLYMLNETRKLMNANVRRLSIWLSAILTLVLVANIVLNAVGVVDAFGPLQGDLCGENTAGALNSLMFGAGSCVLAALVMWALYYTEYSPYQRNTAREMANFLTRYCARLNDHYRTAIGRAKSVTVGEERDSKQLSAEARLWTLNINWIALRVFFIESYVRNVVFQITRNSSYYLLFVPAAFILAVTALFGLAAALDLFNPFATIVALGWVFPVLFILIAMLYAFFLSNSMKALEEIDQGEWISFHTLKLNQVLGEVVGKYAEDVGYWKNRVGGGL